MYNIIPSAHNPFLSFFFSLMYHMFSFFFSYLTIKIKWFTVYLVMIECNIQTYGFMLYSINIIDFGIKMEICIEMKYSNLITSHC